jgi:small subunit ribosomal protein S8
MQDPISDMLTRIRNAQSIMKSAVEMPASKVKQAIAEVLKNEGFIADYSAVEGATHPTMKIDLKYFNGKPVIEMLKRISKPSLRIYKNKDELPRVKDGLGVAVVSTSKGVMTAKQARRLGEGGEILLYVS